MMIYNSFVFNTTTQAISVYWSLKVFGRSCDMWTKITAVCTHSEIYQTCKYDYSEEIVYRTEPEIGNSIHKTTGENR